MEGYEQRCLQTEFQLFFYEDNKSPLDTFAREKSQYRLLLLGRSCFFVDIYLLLIFIQSSKL